MLKLTSKLEYSATTSKVTFKHNTKSLTSKSYLYKFDNLNHSIVNKCRVIQQRAHDLADDYFGVGAEI